MTKIFCGVDLHCETLSKLDQRGNMPCIFTNLG